MALEFHYAKERHVGRWVFSLVLISLLVAVGWSGYEWYTTGRLPSFVPIASAADVTIDESEVSTAQISDYKVAASQPRYINIPLLDVGDTRIYPVALDAGNQIEKPNNIHDVSWYNKSATPGSGEVVILSGHTIGVNHDGVFKNLNTLAVDAQITIKRGDDKAFVYKVVENKTMTLDEANELGISIIGKPVKSNTEGLNIIVASGKWVPKLSTFDHRTIVRATIID